MKNIPLLLGSVVLALGIAGCATHPPPALSPPLVMAQRSYPYRNRLYTVTITKEMQAECPRWEPASQPNPPLAAATAAGKAMRFIQSIETEAPYRWTLRELTLVDLCGWLWRVRFELTVDEGAMHGPPAYMDCYILMNGCVIQPTVTTHTNGFRYFHGEP